MFCELQWTLSVHVDDILCACEYQPDHNELRSHLKKVFVAVNFETGLKLCFLGMTISAEIKGRAVI